MSIFHKKIALIGLFSVLIISSLKAQVVTSVDHSVNFKDYQTFAWVSPDIQIKNPILNNELISRNIQNDVNNALIQKGLKIDTQSPDLLFRFHTYAENAINSGTAGFSPFYGFGRFGFFPYSYGYGPSQYTKGFLAIDAIDAKTQKLVWQGGVSGNITPKKIQVTIYKGVRKIMGKFPV